MKPLIKELLREGLQEKDGLEEGLLGKSFLAGLLMSVGLSWGQIKPEYKAKIDSIMKIENLSPQEKRSEINKIVKLNRNEIRGKKDEIFIRNAVTKNYFKVIDEKTFANGVEEESNDDNPCKDIVYRAMKDGTKIAVNLKGYRDYQKDLSKKPDAGLDLLDPSFTHTSCGISKQHARDDKKAWKEK